MVRMMGMMDGYDGIVFFSFLFLSRMSTLDDGVAFLVFDSLFNH
jgi:hypothetical protein